MSRRLCLLVDMDGILADFYLGVRFAHWEKLGHPQKGGDPIMEDLHEWDAHFSDGTNPRDYWSSPGFFRNLPVIEGSVEALQTLVAQGHRPVIVSSVSYAHSFGEKFDWLGEHFPFIKREDIIFAKSKYLVRGDVMIDDFNENAKEWLAHNPHGVVLGIEYPYNVHHHEAFHRLVPKRGGWDRIVADIALISRLKALSPSEQSK